VKLSLIGAQVPHCNGLVNALEILPLIGRKLVPIMARLRHQGLTRHFVGGHPANSANVSAQFTAGT
jgi:hypothetical protein